MTIPRRADYTLCSGSTLVDQTPDASTNEIWNARDLLGRTLPSQDPVVEGYDISSHSIPREGIGGDFYDFFSYTDGRFAIAFGETSGKGAKAAKFIVQLLTSLRSLGMQGIDPASAAEGLNSIIYSNTEPEQYAALFYGLLTSSSGLFRYCSCGHVPPRLVRKDKTVQELTSGGTVLGLFPNMEFELGEILIEPGDCLTLFSDGVIESEGETEGEFGERRLIEFVIQNSGKASAQLTKELLAFVLRWRSRLYPADGLTVVMIRRHGL